MRLEAAVRQNDGPLTHAMHRHQPLQLAHLPPQTVASGESEQPAVSSQRRKKLRRRAPDFALARSPRAVQTASRLGVPAAGAPRAAPASISGVASVASWRVDARDSTPSQRRIERERVDGVELDRCFVTVLGLVGELEGDSSICYGARTSERSPLREIELAACKDTSRALA